MARLFHSGAEIDAGVAANFDTTTILDPDGRIQSGTITRDTTTFRSGVASWKVASGGSINSELITPVDGRTYFMRGYFFAASSPAAAGVILLLDGGLGLSARLRTDGAVELFANNAAQGSPSAAITDSTWHRVEIKGVATATTKWTAAELLVDGVSVATWSGSFTRSSPPFSWGFAGSGGAGFNLYVDDIAVNDSTGAANTSYPGAGAVVLLKPTADSAVGTGWTLGTGTAIAGNTGKTAVSNTPPLGVADVAAGSDVKQIRNASSNANVNYDATMTTYTAAGVGASDTVNAVIPWVCTSAPVATSAKAGTVGVVSNPAITNINLGATGTSGAFWGGTTAGTYGTGWKWSPGTMTQAPSVTLGTAPVMRITQVTASTRIAMVCDMFIYVDYTPAVAATPSLLVPTTVPTRYQM